MNADGYQGKLAVSSSLACVKKYYDSSLKYNKDLKVTINEATSTQSSCLTKQKDKVKSFTNDEPDSAAS